MDKPVVLFDIDGTFNVLPTIIPGQPAPVKPDDLTQITVPTKVGVLRPHVSPSVIQGVKELLPTIEPMWFTSWFDDALNFGETVGFPAFPVVGSIADLEAEETDLEDEDDLPWWKLELIEKFLPDRKLVWVDDEFHKHAQEVRRVLAASSRVSLVSCDAREGLKLADLHQALTLVS